MTPPRGAAVGMLLGASGSIAGQFAAHWIVYGERSEGPFFALRFLLGPAPLIVMALALLIGILSVLRSRRAGTLMLSGGDWGRTLGWAVLMALGLSALMALAVFEIDASGWWQLGLLILGGGGFLISLPVIAALLAVTALAQRSARRRPAHAEG